MSDWYRIDFPQAPQGHALASRWGSSKFIAWEDINGWKVKRVDDNGYETAEADADDFTEVRQGVETAKTQLEANPQTQSQSQLWKVATGALLGSIGGTLAGNLLGRFSKSHSVRQGAERIGLILGATTGASIAGSLKRTRNPNDELKKKLLR
jgi:hypothetical protein